MGRRRSFENAPVSCRFTPAGLVSGPRMLKIVRVASSARTGPTCFMAGWCTGAIMKAIPASASARSTTSGSTMTSIPICPSRSAAPDLELSILLPCFATMAPAPAATKAAAVEMLSVPLPSPPVPTMSIAPSGPRTFRQRSRIAPAAAAYSSTVSPLARMAISRPPIWAGVASPANSAPNAVAASSFDSGRSAAIPTSGFSVSLMPPPSRFQGSCRAAPCRYGWRSIRDGTAPHASAIHGAAIP